MIAAAQWLRIWVFSMEVPGLNNAGNFFYIFHVPLPPHGECFIRVSQLCDVLKL